MMITSKIIEINSDKPGPTLGIIAGVHGNETAGVFALQQLLPTLSVAKGRLLVAFANPEAIEQNVRMVNKNLNRCFIESNNGDTPEDIRARELMEMFDRCDALLDIHMFYDDDGAPFVICEDNAIDLASKFDVDIISTNWTKVEPGGSDGYMYLKGKIGICIECGPISKAKDYTVFAKKSIFQFLKYFDMTSESVSFSSKKKRVIKASRVVCKKSDNFALSEGLRNFDKLQSGQILAVENNKKYIAGASECIIFPHYNARVGEEAYILGKELNADTTV